VSATVPVKEILASVDQFDLNAPLTAEEVEQAGMLLVLPGAGKERAPAGVPTLQDINEVADDGQADAVTSGGDYNLQYLHYLRCQAVTALTTFDEGWKALEELALKAFVRRCKVENDEYRGSDPNKAFSLRLRQQTAEDFLRFIRAVVVEAAATPKPSLKK
jgi:hypothetical protein